MYAVDSTLYKSTNSLNELKNERECVLDSVEYNKLC